MSRREREEKSMGKGAPMFFGRSFHVLNAISPRLTSSMDFASWIIDHILSNAQNAEAVDKG